MLKTFIGVHRLQKGRWIDVCLSMNFELVTEFLNLTLTNNKERRNVWSTELEHI